MEVDGGASPADSGDVATGLTDSGSGSAPTTPPAGAGKKKNCKPKVAPTVTPDTGSGEQAGGENPEAGASPGDVPASDSEGSGESSQNAGNADAPQADSDSDQVACEEEVVAPVPKQEIEYIIETTTTLSPYYEYEKAYNYVINNKDDPFSLYVVTECRNEIIDLEETSFFGKQMSREAIGNIAVCTDILVSFILLISLWIVTFLVNLDAKRHKNLYFETSEFSIGISDLPRLSWSYDLK